MANDYGMLSQPAGALWSNVSEWDYYDALHLRGDKKWSDDLRRSPGSAMCWSHKSCICQTRRLLQIRNQATKAFILIGVFSLVMHELPPAILGPIPRGESGVFLVKGNIPLSRKLFSISTPGGMWATRGERVPLSPSLHRCPIYLQKMCPLCMLWPRK